MPMRYKASAISFGTFRANSFFGKKLKKRFFFLLNFLGFFFKFSCCLFGGGNAFAILKIAKAFLIFAFANFREEAV